MPRSLVFVASAALALSVRGAGAQDILCDDGDIEVRRLDFSGNQTFKDADLERGIGTTQSSWSRRYLRLGKRYCLDSLEVSKNAVQLVVFYRDHGFPAVRVGAQISPMGKQAARVHFAISEGQPIIVDTLAIVGLDSVPEKDGIVRGLPLRQGARFDRFVLEQTRDSLTRRMRNRGYPSGEALLEWDSDTAARRASVTYKAIPGPRSRIGAIRITVEALQDSSRDSVHTNLDPRAIRSVLGIREGQLYRETNLEGVERGLYLTDAFRHVNVSIDSASLSDPVDSLVTIDVRVVESFLRAARASVGWGNLDCPRAQGSFSNYAFMGRLRRLDLTARVSKVGVGSPLDFNPGLCTSEVRRDPLSDTLNYYAAATLSQAALFGLPFIPALTLYSERRSEFQAFLRDVPFGLIASLQQGANGNTPRTYSYQLEYGSTVAQPAFFCAVFNVCEDAARERLERRERTAVLGWAATRNQANNNANPTSGSVVRLELRHASRVVGSSPEVAFNKGVVDASFYRPAFDGAFAIRLRAGSVLGRKRSFSDSPPFIPLQERLYAGGPNSVRGFRQNELGPAIYIPNVIDTIPIPGDSLVYFRATPGGNRQLVVPTGGENVVVANAELRLRSFFLPELLQYAIFVDAGQVWNRGRSATGINYRDFRVTPGGGARYYSPIGPIRVDVGYNVYASPSGPAYYNPLVEGVFDRTAELRLICVSPGNELRVQLGDSLGVPQRQPPRQIDQGDCPGTYAPARRRTFLSRLTWNFSIGQAF